jgi:hypothetical protein
MKSPIAAIDERDVDRRAAQALDAWILAKPPATATTRWRS